MPTPAPCAIRHRAPSPLGLITAVAMLLIIGSVALAGCGDRFHTPGSGSGSTCPALPTVAPSTTVPGAIARGTVHLTQADNGATLRVQVGTTIVIDLAGEPCYKRTDIVTNGEGVLKQAGGSLTAADGSTASFVADSPGAAGVSSTNDCTGGACAISFQVGIYVVPVTGQGSPP